ncbi:MAG: hypothetical protein E4H03_03490 [Myxococcales bacterium]|jgi:hypothetical protein|nr:MAG: hypothetical protein E4H03_03490 [Myxococcales bacterium]
MNTPAAFDISEMAVALQGDGVEVRRAAAGDSMTLVWISCAKGFDFAPALEGLPHDMCCCEHWGMVTKGRMDIVTHDGMSLTLGVGQTFHLLPGHMPSFPEDCAFFEFTPTEHVERLFSHMGIG